MKTFWGTLKAEMYYLRIVDSYDQLVKAVADYISFHNNSRPQQRLGGLAPAEYRTAYIYDLKRK